MTKEQLDEIKQEIQKAYLYLISHTKFDFKVIELIKLASLAEAEKRYQAGEPW